MYNYLQFLCVCLTGYQLSGFMQYMYVHVAQSVEHCTTFTVVIVKPPDFFSYSNSPNKYEDHFCFLN